MTTYETNVRRIRENILEAFTQERVLITPSSTIEYDPLLIKGDYVIRRASTHDGTLFFTYELYNRVMANLLEGSSYFKSHGMPCDGTAPHYTIGKLKHIIILGMYSINGRDLRGQREMMVLPVKVKWNKREQNEDSP